MFKLSTVITEHKGDIKAISLGPDKSIITASRDQRALVFALDEPQYLLAASIHHQKFVNAVAFVPKCQKYPNGLVASAGQEKVIHLHDLTNPSSPVATLIGHTDNICSLAISGPPDDPLIISGSWDLTCRVWRVNTGECISVFQGHSAAVWGVEKLDDEGGVITASADKTIKIWGGNGELLRTLEGHVGCVRAVVLAGNQLISCGNDGTIRVWNAEDGSCVKTLVGHRDFVYSVAVLRSGEIVSCSEDRTLRVWKDSECIQCIAHPTITVWCVAALPNGDIVTGSSDGIARVFTRALERTAPEEDLKMFEKEVSTYLIPPNEESVVEKESALEENGKNIGDVKTIKNREGSIFEFMWNGVGWEGIGQVRLPDEPSDKIEFKGQLYDFVFDVEQGVDLPAWKLAFNQNDNPYQVAQTFIQREGLSQGFLGQIVSFIMQVARPASSGADTFEAKRVYLLEKETNLITTTEALNPNLTEAEKADLKAVGEILGDQDSYRETVFQPSQYELVKKMLSWQGPEFLPVLDLFAALLLHPHAVEHFCTHSNLVEDLRLSQFAEMPSAHQTGVLRCLVNLFKYGNGRKYVATHINNVVGLIPSDHGDNIWVKLLHNLAVSLTFSKSPRQATQLIASLVKWLKAPHDDVTSAQGWLVIAIVTQAHPKNEEIEKMLEDPALEVVDVRGKLSGIVNMGTITSSL